MKVTNRNSTIGTQVNIENFFSSSVDSVSAWSDELEKLKPLLIRKRKTVTSTLRPRKRRNLQSTRPMTAQQPTIQIPKRLQTI